MTAQPEVLTLDELNARRDSGQHQLATRILENFPSERIAGEILLEVREILADGAAAFADIRAGRTAAPKIILKP